MSDTAGQTPVVVTPDGVVVVAPPFEEVQAFDAATGAARPVPVDVSVPGPVRDERLPDGYRFDDAGLTWHGSVVWSEASSSVPFVARLGAVTVINDFESGLRVVDDLGAVLISPPLGRRNYDETRVVVHGRMAAVVAADGCLYVIEAD